MTKLERSADCANSPKNAAAETLVILLLSAEPEALSPHLSDDATLELVGQHKVQGREAVLQWLASGPLPSLATLRIDHALTHGKVGAVNGVYTARDGSDRGFCVMLEFATTKATQVKQLKLYRP